MLPSTNEEIEELTKPVVSDFVDKPSSPRLKGSVVSKAANISSVPAPLRKDSFYNLQATDITGNEVSFSRFAGKVTLVVNLASQ